MKIQGEHGPPAPRCRRSWVRFGGGGILTETPPKENSSGYLPVNNAQGFITYKIGIRHAIYIDSKN